MFKTYFLSKQKETCLCGRTVSIAILYIWIQYEWFNCKKKCSFWKSPQNRNSANIKSRCNWKCLNPEGTERLCIYKNLSLTLTSAINATTNHQSTHQRCNKLPAITMVWSILSKLHFHYANGKQVEINNSFSFNRSLSFHTGTFWTRNMALFDLTEIAFWPHLNLADEFQDLNVYGGHSFNYAN